MRHTPSPTITLRTELDPGARTSENAPTYVLSFPPTIMDCGGTCSCRTRRRSTRTLRLLG